MTQLLHFFSSYSLFTFLFFHADANKFKDEFEKAKKTNAALEPDIAAAPASGPAASAPADDASTGATVSDTPAADAPAAAAEDAPSTESSKE